LYKDWGKKSFKKIKEKGLKKVTLTIQKVLPNSKAWSPPVFFGSC
jgi:hypothetical protein